MPISTPVAASGARSPERARCIPQAVRSTVFLMIHEATDFITAAKANGLKPDTMRRWLHRPEVISLIRRERAAFRLAICAANEGVSPRLRTPPPTLLSAERDVVTGTTGEPFISGTSLTRSVPSPVQRRAQRRAAA